MMTELDAINNVELVVVDDGSTERFFNETFKGAPSEGHPVDVSANTASSRLLAFEPGRLTSPPPLPA